MQVRLCCAIVFAIFTWQASHAQQREYSVSVNVSGKGSVTANRTTAVRGDTVFLTVLPASGYALLDINARLAPSASGGLSISVRLLSIDAIHYAFVVTADTQVTANFVQQPIDSLGRRPYALYLADHTLLFTNTANRPAVGDTIRGSTITALWGGIAITHKSTSASTSPGWNDTDEEDEPIYPYRHIVFDESFSTVRPTGLSNWFSTYLEGGPRSIEGLPYLNTSEVTTMFGMFWDCASLTEIDVSHFDTRQVKNMAYMFSGCNSLQSLDLSGFDTGKLVNTNRMFDNCFSLEKILCDDTWTVRASSNMFANCPALRGAVAWDGYTLNGTMANPVTGYFTYASGDLDADGRLTPLDVDHLVRLVLQKEAPTRVSDIDHDSRLSLSDVTALVNRLK